MPLKGSNVLVTGGAGFIGSHLVDRLIAEEPGRILVVDNFFLGRESNLDQAKESFDSLEIFRVDASNLAAMQELVNRHDVQVVFDLATIPLPTSLEFPAWTIDTNVSMATVSCELARRGDIETLVHCSSSEAYGSAAYVPMDEAHPVVPTTPYAASKAAADQIVFSYRRTFGIHAVIVRPFNNFGPRQNAGSYAGIIPRVIHRVRSGLPVEIYGDGKQTRDFSYAPDTAEAIVRIINEPKTLGQVLNVATGVETSVSDLIAGILRALDAEDHPVVHLAERPGDVRRHCGDVGLIKSLIDFAPQPLSDRHLEETVAAYFSDQ